MQPGMRGVSPNTDDNRPQSPKPVMDPEECWKSLESKILAGNIALGDMGRCATP